MESHNIPPVFDTSSEILILGSFPSVKSREAEFFYAHPANRFWRVLSYVFDSPVPASTEEKTAFLLGNRIALWDVIASCDIEGSSDSSIKNVIPNNLDEIFSKAPIKAVFVNGKKAEALYNRYMKEKYNREARVLPSTSPANAGKSLDSLCFEWKKEILASLTV